MERESAPADEIYVAFGDGSVTASGVFFGFCLIPERSLLEAHNSLSAAKIKFGRSETSHIHCRELFAEDARRKSEWAHLNEAEAIDLCGEILRTLSPLEAKFLVGWIPSQFYPKRFRLKGKDGYPDIVHDINEKWLMLWLYQNIAGYLDPVDVDTPPDFSVHPRPRNLPFWSFVTRPKTPSLRVRQVFLDREDTRVRWVSKTFKWTTIARELIVERNGVRSYLPIDTRSGPKHSLLEVADIFVYSIARTLSNGRDLDYRDFSGDVLCHLLWGTGEEIVLRNGEDYAQG